MDQITDVAIGSATNYTLVVTIQQTSGVATFTLVNPLSFRVQDERDLTDYWFAHDREGVLVGVLYTIERSSYRDKFSTTISGQTAAFRHYLIVGDDRRVEVLSTTTPQLI